MFRVLVSSIRLASTPHLVHMRHVLMMMMMMMMMIVIHAATRRTHDTPFLAGVGRTVRRRLDIIHLLLTTIYSHARRTDLVPGGYRCGCGCGCGR